MLKSLSLSNNKLSGENTDIKKFFSSDDIHVRIRGDSSQLLDGRKQQDVHVTHIGKID